jgi:predicted dehydrogenase/nucleoside-diphosphate-sugar epimerase
VILHRARSLLGLRGPTATEPLAPTAIEPLAFALVGCGAVAHERYLPAFPDADGCRLVAVVDVDRNRAQAAAAVYREAAGSAVRPATSITEVLDEIDAAVVAVPHNFHLDVSEHLLRRGKHILVEKPLATTVEECDRLAAATPPGVLLAVSTVRRLFPASIWMKELLTGGALGRIERARWEEGGAYGWPLATPSVFNREASGGGVLIDTGPHILDLLLWWFGPETRVVEYRDDTLGGVEADAFLRLAFREAPIDIELSRLRPLANRFIIEGSDARAEIATVSLNAAFSIVDRDARVVKSGRLKSPWPRWETMFSAQLSEFARVARGGQGSVTGLDDGRWTVARITEAYALRRPIRRPWLVQPGPAAAPRGPESELDGLRVAVTGATGFIGGRLVERLVLGSSASVEAVVRSYSRLARLSVLPQERLRFRQADLADPTCDLASALAGCDVVFHCAYGNRGEAPERWGATTEGTRVVAQACAAAGVSRLVHFSTVAVYEVEDLESFDETAPYIEPDPVDLEYGQAKLAAERVLTEIASELDVVVLQPTVVYGPWGGRWTTHALERLPADGAALPTASEPLGVCNAVYIDDVVTAAMLAATVSEAAGGRFLVSGAATSWGAFYDAFREIAGVPAPTPPELDSLPSWERALYASRAIASTTRAREVLGFVPEFDLERGMSLVGPWARWAGLTSLASGGTTPSKRRPSVSMTPGVNRLFGIWRLTTRVFKNAGTK